MKTKIVETYLSSVGNGKIEIPTLCPNCGVSNNPQNSSMGTAMYSDSVIIFISHICTSCNVAFQTLQRFNKVNGKTESNATMIAVYPSTSTTSFDKKLENFSPRFVKSYNEAFKAEQEGLFSLAGMGYRAAEEILIKDFTWKIIEGGSEDAYKKIAKMNLNNTIGHYFKDDDIYLVSTDVVRINGNGYAHWDKPEDFDDKKQLEELKSYLNIFISVVTTKLMILNPPVSR